MREWPPEDLSQLQLRLQPKQSYREIYQVLPCGCWVVSLAQGKLILSCKKHEEAILAAIQIQER